MFTAYNYFPTELYFRGKGNINYENLHGLSNGAICQKKIIIQKGKTVSFDTYFNMFAVFKWLLLYNNAGFEH